MTYSPTTTELIEEYIKDVIENELKPEIINKHLWYVSPESVIFSMQNLSDIFLSKRFTELQGLIKWAENRKGFENRIGDERHEWANNAYNKALDDLITHLKSLL